MDLQLLLGFVMATAALAISPGPDNIFVLTQSISKGVKYGLVTTAGLVSGCLIHTSLLAFGLSAVLKENEEVYFLIKSFGAIYLVYLAYRVYHSPTSLIEESTNGPKKGLKAMFWRGFTMNVLNPKVTLFFLAFFPGFLFSDSISTVVQFYVLGLIFMLVSFLVFALISISASQILKHYRENKKVAEVLKWFQIFIFLGIASYLFFFNK